MSRFFPILLGALALLTSPAFADVVVLKDGRRIEGEVIEQTEEHVKLRSVSGGVYTLDAADVDRIEKEPEDDGSRAKDPAAKDTARYRRWMGTELTAVSSAHFVVRGTHPERDLVRVGAAAEKTFQHFLTTFSCEAKDVLRGPRDRYASHVELFQFRQEQDYHRFLDKVFDRERDRTVNDARFALMKRQRGFWVLTPRLRVVGYQGPSPIESVLSRVAHKTSHVLLSTYRPAGKWRPWWFLEGFAAWQEIETTDHCLTYCLEVAKPGQYAHDKGGPEADEFAKSRTVERWRRRVQERVAGKQALDLGVLGKRTLNELVLDDVIQSWSVVVWLRKQKKLVAFTHAYKEQRDLDKAFQETLGVGIAGAEQQWMAWVAGWRK